jgi:hypothetical protein
MRARAASSKVMLGRLLLLATVPVRNNEAARDATLAGIKQMEEPPKPR